MADVVEYIITETGLAEVRQHGLELALVPALGDTSCDIENGTGSGKQVLTLAGTVGNIVLKPAGVGGNGCSRSNRSIPHQRRCIVVGASLVVVE